jgi:hypothetical protein
MPSHIYSMLGFWEDSIASNRAAIEVQPTTTMRFDFAVYAHLQLGQDTQAKAMLDRQSPPPQRNAAVPVGRRYGAGSDARRLVLERGDWKAAAQLSRPFPRSLPRPNRSPTSPAPSAWRAAAMQPARSARSTRCRRCALSSEGQSVLLGRPHRRADPRRFGWVALAEGARDQAVQLMRGAADSEDASVKNVAMENRLYPMRELLADLLLDAGQAAAACANTKPRSRKRPTVTADSGARPARPKRPATARKPPTTTGSSSHSRKRGRPASGVDARPGVSRAALTSIAWAQRAARLLTGVF